MTAELAARAGGPAECAISTATHATCQALRDGTWIPGQRQRLQQPGRCRPARGQGADAQARPHPR